ncbi:transposase [Candidatus Gracilibacteria bacterium]|nr:transposase [Candidatus Gracilibacteria bacterium]NJM88862.1 transposase [Hydrococcus sp. RU_2_2]
MIVLEYKVKGKESQFFAIDEGIRTAQFIRNKALRLWEDEDKIGKYDLNKYCAKLAKQFPFASKLNSEARQVSAERAWSAIARFYDNCKRKISGKKGYPKYKKHSRSIEYRTSGWKLDSNTKKHITFTDKLGIGRLKLMGSRDIYFYNEDDIKRVRLVKRADGYYCQFSINVDVRLETTPTANSIGLDVGIKEFYADSNGHTEPNPKFYRKAENSLNRANRKKSKKYSKERKKAKQKQSNNYHKARNRYALKHLRVSRQRIEYAKRLAYYVIQSNDLVAYEDLNVLGMIRNRKLAKSISDVAWSTFRCWLEYFGYKYGKVTVAVPPHNTSQNCSNCGEKVQKSLSTRTHICQECGYVEDRDVNAAINILRLGLTTTGHVGCQAWGEGTSTLIGESLSEQVSSVNQESHGAA